MINRPYYREQPFPYNGYYNNSFPQPQQWQYTQTPPINSTFFQTPFEKFSKPKQPNDWYAYMQSNPSFNPPKTNGVLGYFQDKNGQVDLDKMFSTVGQLANTVQQISPVVKQFGSIMKNFQ